MVGSPERLWADVFSAQNVFQFLRLRAREDVIAMRINMPGVTLTIVGKRDWLLCASMVLAPLLFMFCLLGYCSKERILSLIIIVIFSIFAIVFPVITFTEIKPKERR